MIRTQGLTHIHLVVRDLDRSLRLYQQVFGMEEHRALRLPAVRRRRSRRVQFAYVEDPDGYVIEL
jgi:catechol 2,3-dioxygenase-like lactoylglutathione lyase family enzyme